MTKKIICFLLIIFACMQVYATEIDNYNVLKYVILITEAAEPLVIGDYIIFTFQSRERVFFVGAAFDFDNYVKVHQFKKNPEGVFFLVLKTPNTETIQYRLIIDGVWMADPFNPKKRRTQNAVEISVLDLPDVSVGNSYPFTENGITHFRYRGERGQRVYLAGNFNKWDPFMYHMTERQPGEYFTAIRLPPGNHLYNFVVNGVVTSDDGNPNLLWDRDARKISVFNIR